MLHSILIVLLLSRTFAADDHDTYRYPPRVGQKDIENNYISDVPESPASHNAFSFQHSAPSAFVKHDQHFPAPLNHHQYQQQQRQHSHTLYQPPTPATTSRRQFNERESFKSDKFSSPNEQKEYSDYILTARGKENIYEDELLNGHKQHHTEVAYPPKYVESEKTPLKKMNFEKSFKKYRYAYSNRRGNDGPLIHLPAAVKDDHDKASVGSRSEYFIKTRNFNGPNVEGHQHHPYSGHPQQNKFFDKTNVYGAKALPWKQLGPNVEISSSSSAAAENPVYSRQNDVASMGVKKPKHKRKNVPKNMRTGYMTQQHALYVANNLQNLQNLKPSQLRGAFDHSNVLKQSDKFEITDAMIIEAEKEEAQKTALGKGPQKVRIKQELPKEQYYPYEPADIQSFQYYGQAAPQLLHVPNLDSNGLQGKYYAPFAPQLGSFSKGFVRNIEIEVNPSGAKKSIPALIIPLTQEQLNSPYFNNEISVGPVPTPAALSPQSLYVNHPEILNPKPKPVVHSFPYDIVAPARLPPNEVINAIVPVENYHLQQISPSYQYKTTQSLDDGYNSYANYQNQNVYPRVPFNYNPSTTPAAANVESEKTGSVAYSTQSFTIHTGENRPARYSSPNAASLQGRNNNDAPMNAENTDTERKITDYIYEPENDEKYLSPSETSYYTTVTNLKDSDDNSQSYEKPDTRRN